jgi:glycosyltransferase involved in cell wall biosynthesis
MRPVFIGAINQGNPPKGGEEYKNQLLITKINTSFKNTKIIDTLHWNKRPKVWWRLTLNILIKRVDVVIISASSVSTYRLLNLMQWIRPSLLSKTTYLVIGGYFPEGIRSNRFDWRFYKNLKNVVVEGDLLRKTVLNNSGLSNVGVVPNFKSFPNLLIQSNEKFENNFRFVFVGRISKGKGVSEILEAAKILNKSNKEFEVDFYGPVEEEFDFDSNKTGYCGFLDFQYDPEQAYSKLASYDCMLFPTYWKGEGFPGVIIDAFIAGLPVIATDWNMNTEIIEDGINGFIIPPNDAVSLANKMMWVLENRDTLKTIGARNQKKAKEYHIDRIWPKLLEIIK